MARMANPWFSPYSEIYKLTREKNQGSLRPTSGPQEHLATCQHTTVNVWSFGVMLPPSRAFSNQFLHFCPGSHLQILFQVEMMRGVLSRLLHSDLLNGDKKRESPSAVRVTLRTLDEDSTYVDWSILNALYVVRYYWKAIQRYAFLFNWPNMLDIR